MMNWEKDKYEEYKKSTFLYSYEVMKANMIGIDTDVELFNKIA